LIKAGFRDVQAWTDPKKLFMVCYAKAWSKSDQTQTQTKKQVVI
jgi:hypothetical protein